MIVEPHAQLILSLRQGAVTHVDDTGWRIGGHSAWLWVFTQTEMTVYLIDARRSHQVVDQLVGDDYEGIIVCDCLRTFDAMDRDQQKCLAHLLRHTAQIEQQQTQGAVHFPRAVLRLLRAGLRLKQRREHISEHGYKVACGRLEAALDRLLDGRYTNEDNARLARLLVRQRPHLLRFLYHEGLDATNNAAERALRPAVIARKLSAGNRSEKGAQAHTILASIMQTARQKGQDLQQWLRHLLCQPEPSVPDWAQPARPP